MYIAFLVGSPREENVSSIASPNILQKDSLVSTVALTAAGVSSNRSSVLRSCLRLLCIFIAHYQSYLRTYGNKLDL
jgi:hypothetical protein